LGADISRHTFQGHNSASASILCDLGLFGVNDIHDDAALKHLCHSAFYARCADYI
jgi:hypothetical protein